MSNTNTKQIFSRFIVVVVTIASLAFLAPVSITVTRPSFIIPLDYPQSSNLDSSSGELFTISGKLEPPINTIIQLYLLQKYQIGRLIIPIPKLVRWMRSNDDGRFQISEIQSAQYWIIPQRHLLLNSIVPIYPKNHNPKPVIIRDPIDILIGKP